MVKRDINSRTVKTKNWTRAEKFRSVYQGGWDQIPDRPPTLIRDEI